jgi:hypothetical protein
MSFDALLNALPGIAARGLQGRNAAQTETFRRQQLAEEAARRERETAMEESLLQFRMRPPPPPMTPWAAEGLTREEYLQNKRDITDATTHAPAPKDRRFVYETLNIKGVPTRVQIDEDTREQINLGRDWERPLAAKGAGGKPPDRRQWVAAQALRFRNETTTDINQVRTPKYATFDEAVAEAEGAYDRLFPSPATRPAPTAGSPAADDILRQGQASVNRVRRSPPPPAGIAPDDAAQSQADYDARLGGTGGAPPATDGLSAEDLTAARALVAGRPNPKADLEAAGFTPDEIAAILK